MTQIQALTVLVHFQIRVIIVNVQSIIGFRVRFHRDSSPGIRYGIPSLNPFLLIGRANIAHAVDIHGACGVHHHGQFSLGCRLAQGQICQIGRTIAALCHRPVPQHIHHLLAGILTCNARKAIPVNIEATQCIGIMTNYQHPSIFIIQLDGTAKGSRAGYIGNVVLKFPAVRTGGKFLKAHGFLRSTAVDGGVILPFHPHRVEIIEEFRRHPGSFP